MYSMAAKRIPFFFLSLSFFFFSSFTVNTSWERGKRAQRGIKKRKGERKKEGRRGRGYQYFIPSRERHLKTKNGESCMHINERGHRLLWIRFVSPDAGKKGISLTIGAPPPLRAPATGSQEISDTVAFDDWTNYLAWLYFIVSSFILATYVYISFYFSFAIPFHLFFGLLSFCFCFRDKEDLDALRVFPFFFIGRGKGFDSKTRSFRSFLFSLSFPTIIARH